MKKKLFLILVLLSVSAAGFFTSAYSADGKFLGKISETSSSTREIIVRAPKSGENIHG